MTVEHAVEELEGVLGSLSKDLEKAKKGNKAAAQRVRTGTILLQKIAKVYRKESVLSEKSKA